MLQDHIIPYMADDRHAPDTLFFVVEEDFRLFERHSQAQPSILQGVAEAAYAASSTAYTARPAFAETLNEQDGAPVALTLDELYHWRYQAAPHTAAQLEIFGPPAAGTDSWRALVGGLYAPVSKPSAAEVAEIGVSQYLEDCVKMVTAAHREGLGNLVWLSYEARNSKGQRNRVCHGSTLVAVSAEGAKKLADIVPDAAVFGRDAHFDVLLIKYLNKHGNAFGASYVHPSVGHYQAHLSQSSEREGWRDSKWQNTWVQEGTRPSHTFAGRTRWLLAWVDKGNDWKRPIALPERGGEDLRWLTRSPAPAGWIEEEQARRLAQREHAKGRGKASRALPIVIQPFATDEPTDADGNPALDTARRKRARRANMVGYAFRIFVPPEQQVVLGNKKALSLSPSTRVKKISMLSPEPVAGCIRKKRPEPSAGRICIR